MSFLRTIVAIVLMVSAGLVSIPAWPQAAPEPSSAFPSRPIRIVTADAASGIDATARIVANAVTAQMGQRVLVENRGGGVVAGEIIARSAPDGYNLLYYGATFWLLPLMRTNMPYDVVRDFAPLAITSTSPSVLVVHPSLPAKSVKELIALAKARPGQLNYGGGATGTGGHLGAELFKSMAGGLDIVRVVYKGAGGALTDIIAGQIQILFATVPAAMPHVKSGRLRLLAVTSAQPSAFFPGLSTVAESGVPGYELSATAAMFAPAKTPPALVNRLNQEIVRAVNSPLARERLESLGSEVVGSTPAELGAYMKAEMTRMGKVIRALGIRDE